jgi:hypothetical protein
LNADYYVGLEIPLAMIAYHAVSRTELRSPASSRQPSPDPDLTERLRSRALDEFTFTSTAEHGDHYNGPDGAAVEDEEEEEAELVLFAAPASAAPQTHKIRLQSPDAARGDGGFVVKRPRSYYFADETDSEREREYQTAAVDAGTILELARMPWPGCAVPWKVKTISAKGITKSVLVGHPNVLLSVEEKERKRTRKGKKSRIALRTKIRAREGKKAEEEKARKEKEEAEREKRTRRNREKKLKKKAKEKAKKAADGENVEAAVEEETLAPPTGARDGS